MRNISIFICICITLIKCMEAGVITNAARIANTNRIDGSIQYSEPDSEVPDELELENKPKLPNQPVVYIKGLKNIEAMVKNTADIDALYGYGKRASKLDLIKTRLHDILIRNLLSHYSKIEQLPILSDLENYEGDRKDDTDVDEVAEIFVFDDTTTEDIPKSEDEIAENDDRNLLEDFIRSRTVIPIKSDCNNELEEKKDLGEFIFMPQLKDIDGDALDDGDIEINTPYEVEESRNKRGVNMIEEENMGTTISGLKFTGYDSRISNDIYFKNIHS